MLRMIRAHTHVMPTYSRERGAEAAGARTALKGQAASTGRTVSQGAGGLEGRFVHVQLRFIAAPAGSRRASRARRLQAGRIMPVSTRS